MRLVEIKFLVPPDRIDDVQKWARLRLAPDPFASGGDQYRTSTLYFDTRELDVFFRRGSYGRSKYRIRRYGRADHVFLERKLKTQDRVSKRRSVVDLSELYRLESGEARKDDRWAGSWFHRRMLLRDLQLACQVSYLRTALVCPNRHGMVRLTLDEDLRVIPALLLEFRPTERGLTPAGGNAILEMKYHGAIPSVFQEMCERFALTRQVVSKYRLSMAALGYTAQEASA